MGSADSGDELITTAYDDLMDWVTGYFVILVGDGVGYRDGERIHWCPQWWRHPGAVVRLDALWRAWEYCRHVGAFGISQWLLDHADPHVRVLLSPSGPFQHCSGEHGHRATEPLPVVDLPTEVPVFSAPKLPGDSRA
ncbi:hypothetical protein NN3_33830 [Nocardia neocaledoniensis NBRC 108232]|uniref:Uncharacterized protein DUF4913 n=1 Tax=Nocardia neocaledoniensis TaxID=236511 RepID=A0A317NQG5_9NOCA|nr:DUF4913 domain-containing protein [Nocardia neocaledoniensis]PWV77510.1 uncharacterized protein DUF4913 [Nocardia neocaledoniensis]GEM32376.1 hypothetical protein NN3_33830 [Nocardia neocaledoniensis NBRC 108232]